MKIGVVSVERISRLPTGTYCGHWGANKVDVHIQGVAYQLTTSIYVKGINIPVRVEVAENGAVTVEPLDGK